MNDKSKNLVFIDDAGDPGFKLDRGSINYFVMACVIFDKSIVIEEVLSNTPDLEDASVRLDGHADREYRRTAVAYFRKQVNRSEYKIVTNTGFLYND
jgi:hypothetical protein